MSKINNAGPSVPWVSFDDSSQVNAAAPPESPESVPVTYYPRNTRDLFEGAPLPSRKAEYPAASASVYGGFPAFAHVGKDTMPRSVLAQAAQGRFEKFQPATFGNDVSKEQLPLPVKRLFDSGIAQGNQPSFFAIKVAGTPVFAMLTRDAQANTMVLADRDGKQLSAGCFLRAQDGSLTPPFWKSRG